MARKVTAGLAESNGSLPPGLRLCTCLSVWAWWEVVAARHHRVHDHACCHLQADCLESGISFGPLRSTLSMGTFTLPFKSIGGLRLEAIEGLAESNDSLPPGL